MTLQHGNRVRKNGGKQVVRELELADLVEMADHGPTEDQVRQRAHETHLRRASVPGNHLVDWLRVELELCAHKAKKAS
jgi:hypothetical protein